MLFQFHFAFCNLDFAICISSVLLFIRHPAEKSQSDRADDEHNVHHAARTVRGSDRGWYEEVHQENEKDEDGDDDPRHAQNFGHSLRSSTVHCQPVFPWLPRFAIIIADLHLSPLFRYP